MRGKSPLGATPCGTSKRGGPWQRLLPLILVLTTVAGAAAARPAPASGAAPIRHIWLIELENSSWRNNFGNAPAGDPYKGQVLPGLGTVIQNYYAIGHNSLDNYIAQISGQAPTPDTQGDCLFPSDLTPGTQDAPQDQAIGQGCTYPARVKTIADQLKAKGLAWKGYEEDMGTDLVQDGRPTCSTANQNNYTPQTDQYLAKHDPFVWFHSVLDDLPDCQSHVVPLTDLEPDLERLATTPNFSFISPNMKDDDHDIKTSAAANFHYSDGWLHYYVPLIMASPAFRKDGMIIVTYDEADSALGFAGQPSDQTGCCGEIPGPNSPLPGVGGTGGGQVGAEVISPYVKGGVLTTANSYNHYSALRSFEDLLGITTGGADGQGHLGYAAGNGAPNSAVGFRSFGCDDIFTITCPPMATQVPASGQTAPGNDVGPRPPDGSVHWLNPAPQGNDLYSVSCSTDTHCVAVGATGSVVSTSDGSGWSWRDSGTRADLHGVSCAAPDLSCIAVGAGGTVLRTGDGGQTWSRISSGVGQDLTSVTCPSASRCYAVGAGGTIIASGDGGATWSKQSSPAEADLDQIACPNPTTCYVSGDLASPGKPASATPEVVSTTDGGATWVRSTAATAGRTRGLGCVDSSRCTTGDERGVFSFTSNGGNGNTWSVASTGPSDHKKTRVRGVSCLASGMCVAVGESGFTYRSTDGGRNWSVADQSTDFVDLYSLSCPSTGHCYAVGRNGAILASGDEGATWTASYVDQAASNLMRGVSGDASPPATTVGAVDLTGTSCPDASSCVSVGNQGVVLVSGDRGNFWKARHGALKHDPVAAGQGASPTPAPIPVATDTVGLSAVSCPSATSCVAVGDSDSSTKQAKIITTSDAGGSWSPASSNAAGRLSGVSCPTPAACFAVGEYGTILKSADGGSNWTPEDSGTLDFLNAISCADASDCVAVGSQGTILSTRDGSTWKSQASPTSSYLSAVSCATATSCMAVGSDGTVLGGSDGGETWSVGGPPSGDDLYAVSCANVSHCVVTGSGGTVASTADGGQSWKLQGTGTTDLLRSISCRGVGRCLAAGVHGAILEINPTAVSHPPAVTSSGISDGTVTSVPAGVGLLSSFPTACARSSRLRLALRAPRGRRIVRAVAYLRGRRIKSVRARRLTSVVVPWPRSSRFSVTFIAWTNRGERLRTVVSYASCRLYVRRYPIQRPRRR